MLGGLLDAIAQLCLRLVEALGYAGVFLLMVLESMIFPVPSEAVLPPAGWLAFEGRMSFWLALVAATAGTLVGSLLSYAMGRYGVRPLVERWGRYVLVSAHHLDLAQRFFERRGAGVAIFLSRFVPVVRHLVSIPAGSARMPLPTFVAATLAGGALWNAALLYAGFKLGESWPAVTAAAEHAKLPLLAAALALAGLSAAWFMLRKKKVAAAKPLA